MRSHLFKEPCHDHPADPVIDELTAEISQQLANQDLAALAATLAPVADAELVSVFERLTLRQRAVIFRLLPKETAVAVFDALDPALQGLHDTEVARLFAELDPDDRAWLLEEVPAVLATRLLRDLPGSERALTAALLGYPQGGVGRRMGRLDLTGRRDLLDLFTKSAGDWLDGWFESDPIKALFGFDGIVGAYASPYTPGTAYVLLHHVFGEVNGKKGVWGHAVGGMGAITQAMARSAVEAGVEIRTDAAVSKVLVEEGRAVGVVLADGEVLHGKAIVANVNPKLLYERLFDPADVPAATLERMANWRCGSGTFRMNVALSKLPESNLIRKSTLSLN